ncbi:hypothetical protein BDV29DRAFT_183534 [Aspergillus leporis]|uniref:Uncharacterized protein n=1 Tax=Aspergillus leporis TaxID=41062 RepID=A0A5N5WPA8_9EURO|nr:hypothetical protein BDV29DRAFT_183534 [Aspergillus leporis]
MGSSATFTAMPARTRTTIYLQVGTCRSMVNNNPSCAFGLCGSLHMESLSGRLVFSQGLRHHCQARMATAW